MAVSGGKNDQPKTQTGDDVWMVKNAMKIGALSGTSGLLFGGITGIIRSPNPVIHSISAGIHWFAFGASFWWLRSNILRVQFEDKPTPGQRGVASAVSSGLAGGAISYSIHRRFVPGAVIFSLGGFLGQKTYDVIDGWQVARENKPQKPMGQRILESRWLPLRPLSDEQYMSMLDEKLLGINAEIAIIDEKIEALRNVEASSSSSSASS
ncbi:hypothetical protein FQN53_002453 [Emmonsiellopsis sp. PD_33]|nr:hypothetical protein FQN53_002453 [Emmonsiellopsis sp. PD_33]